MKNGITINGIAYAVRKQLNEVNSMDDTCGKCAIRTRCKTRGGQPCLLFEDRNHEVYFVKTEQDD